MTRWREHPVHISKTLQDGDNVKDERRSNIQANTLFGRCWRSSGKVTQIICSLSNYRCRLLRSLQWMVRWCVYMQHELRRVSQCSKYRIRTFMLEPSDLPLFSVSTTWQVRSAVCLVLSRISSVLYFSQGLTCSNDNDHLYMFFANVGDVDAFKMVERVLPFGKV